MADLTSLIEGCLERQERLVPNEWVRNIPRDRPAYVHWNVVAAIDELLELMKTMSWKPWSADYGNDREPIMARAHEGVDVLLFLGNILGVLGVTDDDLAAAYDEKVSLIEERAGTVR